MEIKWPADWGGLSSRRVYSSRLLLLFTSNSPPSPPHLVLSDEITFLLDYAGFLFILTLHANG